MRLFSCSVLVIVACSGSRSNPEELRDAAIDAHRDAPIDAPMDAPIDSSPDAPPPPSTCPSTASILLDVSPRKISNIAAAGSTLYVGVYKMDNTTISQAAVLAIDIATGAEIGTPLATTGVPTVWSVDGEVYASDYSATGSIWKLQAPAAPTVVVTGRDRPGAVTADATHVFWSEASGIDNVVRRKAFANATIEDVTPCTSPRRLFVDANDLYCAPFANSIVRAPKTGGQATTISVGTYQVTAAILDGNELYATSIYTRPQIWRVPKPNGPATLVHQVAELGRYSGVAMSPTYFYTVDSNYGVRRIHRTSLDVDRIYNALLVGGEPLLTNGKLYFLTYNPQLSGPNYVMHCTD